MMKKEKIKVMAMRVNEVPRKIELQNTLEALQEFVGGYIETVTIGDYVVVCDEEGLLKNKPYNCTMVGIPFCGDILICGIDGEEFGDVPPSGEMAAMLR